MSQNAQQFARAAGASLLGLGLQLLVFGLLLGLGLWSGDPATLAVAWYAAGGLPLWICLWMAHQQLRLERLEALESERLAHTPGLEAALFERTAADLSVARRRLEAFYRWGLPLTGILTGAYLVTCGALLLRERLPQFALSTENNSYVVSEPLRGLACSAIAALVSFLVSRYLAGMARNVAWQLLRGGAGYLMGNVLLAAALSAGFVLAHFELPATLRALALAVPAAMCLVGAEILLNLILGIFRPRKAGEVPRPAFDSRFLGLLTNPEGLAAAFGDAVNYQFGFEISRSWFWQLLGRALLPLLGFAIAVLLALSSVIIVEPHQQALVTRFGRMVGEPLDPGPHLKWPWPIERVRAYDVSRIFEIHVGSQEKAKPGTPILWANQHSEGEEGLLIVASGNPAAGLPDLDRKERAASKRGAPPISLIVADVPVQYRIADLKRYAYRSADAERWLRSIAEREVAAYLFTLDVDQVLGPERLQAGERLRQIIQEATDDQNLGLEIVTVGLAGVHPHSKVAEAFHETVRARQEKEAKTEQARQDAIKTLVEAAGTAEHASELERNIALLEKVQNAGTPLAGAPTAEQLEETLDRLLRDSGGQAAVRLAEARAGRWTKENAERGKAERFTKELHVYLLAPDYYKARRYLEALESGLASARKYMLVANRDKLTVRMDLSDQETGIKGIDVLKDK